MEKKIADKIGNEGTLKIKGTCEEPIYIIREASSIPVPALKKEVPKEVKEPNVHLNEKELLRMAYERWEKRFN